MIIARRQAGQPIIATSSLLHRLVLLDADQPAHDVVLLLEPLLPAPQALHLGVAQPLEPVQVALQVLGEHVLVEAAAREPPRGVAPGKVAVGPAGAVEVPAAGDVEDAAADGEVDGAALLAGEGEEGRRGVGPEDGRRRRGRVLLLGGPRGEDGRVECVGEDGEEDEVEGGREGGGAAVPGQRSEPVKNVIVV